jgi:hypothetical protein
MGVSSVESGHDGIIYEFRCAGSAVGLVVIPQVVVLKNIWTCRIPNATAASLPGSSTEASISTNPFIGDEGGEKC